MSNDNLHQQHLKAINILLVEDNEADVKITLRSFKKSIVQSNINVVNDGQEALDYIYGTGKFSDRATYPMPNVILMDLNMPKLTGLQVLEKLKSDPEYKAIPIVMLTSSKNEEDVIKCYQSGANSYIKKPVNYEDFESVTKNFMDYWKNTIILP